MGVISALLETYLSYHTTDSDTYSSAHCPIRPIHLQEFLNSCMPAVVSSKAWVRIIVYSEELFVNYRAIHSTELCCHLSVRPSVCPSVTLSYAYSCRFGYFGTSLLIRSSTVGNIVQKEHPKQDFLLKDGDSLLQLAWTQDEARDNKTPQASRGWGAVSPPHPQPIKGSGGASWAPLPAETRPKK